MTQEQTSSEMLQALRAENEQLRREAAFFKSANEILAIKLSRLAAQLVPAR